MEAVGHQSSDKKKNSKHSASFRFLYLVCLVEGADLQLLPSTFRSLEAEVGLSPTGLAALATCQALSQSLSAPVWGSLVDSGWSEKSLLVGGSMAWGVLTLLLAGTTEWYSMLALRTLNGLALASLTPVSQAIIAKSTPATERGYYFGLCELALCMGQLLCTILATPISNKTMWGVRGWRVAFATVALTSLALSLVLNALMRDLGPKARRVVDFRAELGVLRHCCAIRTFRVIVLQGCFGSIPWSAFGTFAIMFFQYVGVRDLQAAALFVTSLVALGFGNILGGHVGDTLARWSRFHGRPLTAQISVLSGIPLIVWLVAFIPREASSVSQYGAVMCIFGLTASWCKTGVNRPILAEVVPEGSLARILSWFIAFDGAVAACLGPLVAGLIAEAFGYTPLQGHLDEVPAVLRAKNARALAMGMLWMCVVPWTVCFFVFGLLHLTYKPDVERAARADAETNALLSY